MGSSKSKTWFMLFTKGLIMIFLAILVFSSPADALLTYVLYIGLGYVVAGFIRLVQGFQAKGTIDGWGSIVFEGIIDIIVGIVLMAHPGLTAAMLPFLLGLWGTFYGFYLLIDAFSGTGGMGWKLIAGALITLLGFTIMFNPVMLGMTITVWIGIMLFVVGIYNIIASFSLK